MELKDVFKKILYLHEIKQKEFLSREAVDLTQFLDYTQEQLNIARKYNSHQFVKGKFSEDIESIEKLLEVIAKMLSQQKEKSHNKAGTYSECATALLIKNITIDTKGIGVNDGINYVELFGLKPGKKLYNTLNTLGKTTTFESRAKEIIRKYKIGQK